MTRTHILVAAGLAVWALASFSEAVGFRRSLAATRDIGVDQTATYRRLGSSELSGSLVAGAAIVTILDAWAWSRWWALPVAAFAAWALFAALCRLFRLPVQ
jgi:hypothetical protein